MDRIMIIGFSGCGKSTLARDLGQILGIQPTHMDTLNWLPGWVESSYEHKISLLAPIIKQDRWIIEGSYKRILWKERIENADTVIFLDFNRFLCLYRVIKRRFMYNNKTRPDMGKGCPERLDAEFLKWVVWGGRKKRRKNYEQMNMLKQHTDKQIYIFRRPKEVKNFLYNLSKGMVK